MHGSMPDDSDMNEKEDVVHDNLEEAANKQKDDM